LNPSRNPELTAVRPMRAITVSAPARLHLGFVDLNGSLGRKYGSIGLAVDQPTTSLTVRKSDRFSSAGAESERAEKALRRFADLFAHGQAFAVDVQQSIPAHAGLGSGTQLALAVGAAVLRLAGSEASARSLGEVVERGARSAIGITAFERGGFIVDGGRGSLNRPPPTIVRLDFPPEWRAILVLDPRDVGVHGEKEAVAFKALPEFAEAVAGHLCRLTLMRLLPGIVERDIASFGAALSEIQTLVGNHFSAAQGGEPWSNPAVGRIVRRLGDAGATGLGQSSWGPTGFAFVESETAAHRLYSSLVEEAKATGLDLKIVQGRNTGAVVAPV
jgi:beta-ribofuranosylaminobenzene 5'-phosphate synthase